MVPQSLTSRKTASVTDLREPAKIMDAANGQPVAILKNNRQIATLIPYVNSAEQEMTAVSNEDLAAALQLTDSQDRPILEYLKSR